MNWRDVLERAGWTFLQTFLSVLLVSEIGWLTADALKVAAIAGLAAVLSLVKTVAVQKLKEG